MLDTFHDRMGDQYALLSSAERKAGWARVIGQRMKQEWAGSVEPKFSGNIWIGQAGADLLERQRDDGLSDRLGFFGSYGQASGNVSGFVEGRHGNSAGSLRLNAYGLGLYWTRLKRTDWYWDNVLMANYYDGRSRSDRGVGADMDGWGLTASTEFGYSFHPSPDIMIQPQAQLFYQYTDIGNTKDQYSSIRFSGSGAVTGRLGILVQGNADNPDKIRPYARFNLWRRMGHGETVVFGDSDTLRTEYGSTSADVRVGLVAPLSKQTQLYASAGYGFDLDGNQRQAYYGNIGVRYKW
jgi:outer membrane autotransporter protein